MIPSFAVDTSLPLNDLHFLSAYNNADSIDQGFWAASPFTQASTSVCKGEILPSAREHF